MSETDDLTQWLRSVRCLDKRPSIPIYMTCQQVEGDDFIGTSEPMAHHHCAAAALTDLATNDPDRFAEMFGLQRWYMSDEEYEDLSTAQQDAVLDWPTLYYRKEDTRG